MNTINKCMAQVANNGEDLPVAPLINDVQLLTKEERKETLKFNQEKQDEASNEDLQNAIRQH